MTAKETQKNKNRNNDGSRSIPYGMKTKRLIFCFLMISALIAIPTFSILAEDSNEYTLLEPLPIGAGGDPVKSVNLATYLEEIFRLVIILAGALAVFQLIRGGIMYITSAAFNTKNEAKQIINETLMGLGLVLGSWIIVATVFSGTDTVKDGAFTIDLSIPVIKTTPNTNPPGEGGGGGGGSGTGCQGVCPYSYTSGGQTIKYKDCASCSQATSFGLTIKTARIDGKDAQINTALGNKLKAVNQTSGNPGFRVTETWPPTVNHRNQGQYDGTSVDVGLNSISTANINAFLKNARDQGLSAVYEVGTAGQRDSYVRGGVPAGSIIVVPYISGEHFSIK